MTAQETDVARTDDEVPVVPREDEDVPVFSPQVDIVENEESVEIVADMPGVSKDDVDILMEKGVLTITGRQKEERLPEMDLRRQEYEVGDFHRRFALGEGLDLENTENVSASMDDGVLRLTIPKSEQFKPRQIEIE
ncbi:MAG: Hsp20/alpha crystallin family protein [Planctomycetota bacterium]